MGSNDQPELQVLTTGISSSLSIDNLDDVARAAKMIYQSGAFGKLNNSQEAGAKIMAGLELGLSPMTAVRNIYFFDGSVTLSGPILAALIRQHPEYDYRILGANQQGAKVRFFRREVVDGEPKMVPQEPDVQFTRKMADKAGLLSKQNWQQFPEDMYVWRCVARGSRWHCPEVGKGTLYIPDEVKHGTVEAQPVEEIEADEDAPDEPEVAGDAKQVPEQTTATDTPEFTEKEETSEVKPKEPKPTPDTEDRRKPLNPDAGSDGSTKESGNQPEEPPNGGVEKDTASGGGGGSKGAPAKPTAEATAPANTPSTTEDNGEQDSGPSGQMEDPEERLSAMLPSYVTVNAGAITKEAAQKAKAMQTKLRAMDPGNALLTQIKEYREEVRDGFPNHVDADRVALDEVLDHHISRIGGSEPEKPQQTENTAEQPEDIGETGAEQPQNNGEQPGASVPGTPEPDHSADSVADDVEVPGMPWFDSIGRKFRSDMETVRDVLRGEMAKKGITPLKSRLDEIKNRFEDADKTPRHEAAFQKSIKPFETVVSMREAIIGGTGDPEIEVFNQAVQELLETTEEFSNETRKAWSERIVVREARRLEEEFEDLSLSIEDWEAEVQAPEEGEDSGETGVPDIPLPPGFPKKEALTDAGITRTGEVAERLSSGTLTSVKGIGEAYAEQIAEYLRSISDDGTTEEIGF